MSNSHLPTARRLRHAVTRRLPERRDDSGLTTLEWLLIVAAVAGMAALAVVLVTNVISDTSEQVEGQSARRTAAELAADEIEDEIGSMTWAASGGGTTGWNAANDEGEDKCHRLRLIYGDVDDLTVSWTDGVQGTGNNSTAFGTGTNQPQCNIT